MALTPRQKQVLDFLTDFQRDRGFNPSYEEIARGLKLSSVATVHKHISALEKKNCLHRDPNKSRSIEVSPRYAQERNRRPPASALEIPICGTIAAGQPVDTFETRDTLNFAEFVGHKDTFALRVRGDSMIDEHICEGDVILVERADQARSGEIVVALVRGTETTLKRFYPEPAGVVRLQPANSSMSPIRVPARDVQIQGRLLAVLRKY